jgi:nucleotide-binding universal stress UspA family protein
MEEQDMFQHILFATDGSPASRLAAEQCLRFAGQIGARVTAVHVVTPLNLFTYEPMATEELRAAYRRSRDDHARACLGPLGELARNGAVTLETQLIEADEPYEAIVTAARDHGCDLIAMASHGLKGLKGVLVGSQTQKVLTHSALPVLVFR